MKALRQLQNTSMSALVPFLGANVSPHSLQPLDQRWVAVVEGAVPWVGILREKQRPNEKRVLGDGTSQTKGYLWSQKARETSVDKTGR